MRSNIARSERDRHQLVARWTSEAQRHGSQRTYFHQLSPAEPTTLLLGPSTRPFTWRQQFAILIHFHTQPSSTRPHGSTHLETIVQSRDCPPVQKTLARCFSNQALLYNTTHGNNYEPHSFKHHPLRPCRVSATGRGPDLKGMRGALLPKHTPHPPRLAARRAARVVCGREAG